MPVVLCLDHSSIGGFEGLGVAVFSSRTLVRHHIRLSRFVMDEPGRIEMILMGLRLSSHLGFIAGRLSLPDIAVEAVYSVSLHYPGLDAFIRRLADTLRDSSTIIVHHDYGGREDYWGKYIVGKLRARGFSGTVFTYLVGKSHLVSICDVAARYAALTSAGRFNEEYRELRRVLSRFKSKFYTF